MKNQQRSDHRKSLSRVIDAEAIERKRIADMLHDDLQQHLIALKFRLWNLVPRDQMDETVTRRLAVFGQLLDESIQKSREITYELNPPVLHQKGLLPALEWLIAETKDRHGLKTTLQTNGDMEITETALPVILFNSIKELLKNIVKHSASKTAVVDMKADGNTLRIHVEDSGIGFDSSAGFPEKDPPGFGLSVIEKRIRASGGRVEIESMPGKGCRVTLYLPKD